MRKLMPPFICFLAITALALLLLTKSQPNQRAEDGQIEHHKEICIHGENCSHGNKLNRGAGTSTVAKTYPAVTLTHSLAKENKSISEAIAGDSLTLDFGDNLVLNARVRFTKTSPDSRQSVSMELVGKRGWVHWLKRADGGIMGNILLKEGDKNIVYKYSGEEGDLVIQRITQQEFICSSGDTDASVGMPTSDDPFEPAAQAGNIPLLESLPDAEAVVYIDFDGEQVSGTRWNTLEGRPETINAQPAGFDEARIREVWEEVAEDMRPFKINVTTDRAVFDAAAIGKRMMSIVTPTTDAFPGSGGVAFLNSFYDGNDDPCWTFNLSPSSCAQTVSHEVGHTFGLRHDGLLGQPEQTEYHRGNGTWGPIMGAPFGLNVVSWSDGAYEGATNTENDLQIINDRSAEFRDDQYGDTDAEGFDFAGDSFDETVDIEGVIETPQDIDVFTFTTSGGTITLNAQPEGVDISGQGFVTNMNIRLAVYNEVGELVTEADPADSYGASITTELESGNYTFHVEGTNSGSPDVSGFSDYGSIGQYSVTGNIPGLGGDGDLTPPSADLLDPANGEIADLRLLNLQGYLEVTFTDIGQGIDPDSIDGNELALSGGGLGDVVLDGSVTPVIAGSTYRYGFTGSFVEGNVNVEFVAGSFADISDLANVNEAETESFTVERQPFTEFIDDADDGFSASAGWNVYTGNSAISGYNSDFTYAQSGDGSETVSWTFEGLDPGSYEVAITWHARDVYRASNAPYSVFDGATLVSSTTVDQGVEPTADYIKAGKAFEVVFASVVISSNTLTVQLSNDADDYVIADAIRIKQLEPSAPTADLVSPGDGDSISLTLLNARTYLDVTFSDIGQGINPLSIDGDELLLGGSGLNTVVPAVGAPTLISGTTYRYELTGEFIEGEVNVTFVAGSFADAADTPNVNLEETESFTVTLDPPPSSLIIDDADLGFSSTDGWSVYPGNESINGYNNDFTYTQPGTTTELATWTFEGLLPGDYEVAITWHARDIYRASDAPFTVYDGTNPVSDNTVNQQVEPAADYIEGDKPFQIVFASVNVSSGTLVVELSNAADDYVIADAVRIELLEPAGPDVTAPTADLSNPANGSTIDLDILNAQGFVEVNFADSGDGVNNATITGNELLLSGTGAAGVTLSGTAIRQGTSDTYRYGFTGNFVVGGVDVTFVAGSFEDLAGTPNANEAETESFTVADAPPPPASQTVDDADPGFTASAGWGVYLGNTAIDGYNNDFTYSAPASETSPGTASWTFSGLIPGSYEVAVTWHAREVYRASNAPYNVYDGIPNGVTNLIDSASVDQGAEPTADYVEGGKNFEVVFASVVISSSTLVVELSNEADDYVIADAVRIKLLEPAGPEPTLPTANLTSPANGFTVDPSVLNAQGYLEVSFSGSDDGLDLTTIDGDELSLSGAGVGTAQLIAAAPSLVSDTTYRYAFTGEFVDGVVDVEFVAGSFADQIIPNFNEAETESFTVATAPPVLSSAPVADLVNPAEGDIIDPALLNAQGYLEVVFSDIDDGLDLSTIDGDELALSGTGVGTATLDGTAILVSGTTYRYGFTGSFVVGSVQVDVIAGSFADLAIPNLNLADNESFTLAAPLAEAQVLYRINCGGSQLASIDDEPLDWAVDSFNNPSPYVNSAATNKTYTVGSTITAGASVPSGVPLALFQSERYDLSTSPEMQWNFPLSNGDYEVRLYFAETYSGTGSPGQRVFDVAIEGNIVLDDYDVVADAGAMFVGVMQSAQVVVSDELLTIDLLHVIENPAVKGIEIIKLNTINKPPVILPVADQNNTVADLVSVQVIASDDDGDTLSYSAQDLPAGLSIDSVSGLISGTIASGANLNSPYAVTVTVSDDGNPQESAVTSFIWTVNVEGPNNNTLTITPVTNQSNAVEDSINLQVSASDTNGNTLSYSANGLPAGLSINSSSGLISGIIATGADLNSPYAVTVTVADDGIPQASASTSFVWTVSGEPSNKVPTITPTADQTNTVADAVNLQITATDPNTEDVLSYGAAGLPAGLFINTATGLISGNIATDAELNSPYNVTITVTDDGEPQESATSSFAWTINALPPETELLFRINCGGNQLSSVDDEPLDWSADSSASPSAYVNSGETNNTFSTNNPVTTAASVPDGVPLALFQSERWDSGSSPEMQWNFPVNNGEYEVRLYFAETYSGAGSPGQRVFDVALEGNIVLDDYDVVADAGAMFVGVMQSFQVSVSDESLTIDLLHVVENPAIKGIEIIGLNGTGGPLNNAPTVTEIADQTNSVTDTVSLQVLASDADPGDTLGYSAAGLPEGLSIDTATGLISGNIASNAELNSPYNVTVTVTDDGEPQESADVSFAWTINALPPATPVVYRVNCGGSQLASVDSEPLDWSADSSANPSAYVNSGDTNNTFSTSSPVTSAASVPGGVPLALFQSERWDSGSSPEMQWNFPVNNGEYEVRLYFAETYSGTGSPGQRVFDVALEGNIVLDDYDVVADAGAMFVGVMQSFQVSVSDESLTIDLLHVIENPAIKGIEILQIATQGLASTNISATSEEVTPTATLSGEIHTGSSLEEIYLPPNNADTDGDGVADTHDIFPRDSDITTISDYINLIINYIVDDRVIFDSDWKEPENEAEFVAKLEALLAIVIAAEQAQDNEWAALLYLEALKKLGDELIVRTDGFDNAASLANDWVTTQEAQDLIHADLILLSEYLWLSVR